jgi:Holliday junction resolvase-like predicted endonuclease
VREVAQVYLSQTKRYEAKLRFDVIAVELGADESAATNIEHIENAF